MDYSHVIVTGRRLDTRDGVIESGQKQDRGSGPVMRGWSMCVCVCTCSHVTCGRVVLLVLW